MVLLVNIVTGTDYAAFISLSVLYGILCVFYDTMVEGDNLCLFMSITLILVMVCAESFRELFIQCKPFILEHFSVDVKELISQFNALDVETPTSEFCNFLAAVINEENLEAMKPIVLHNYTLT